MVNVLHNLPFSYTLNVPLKCPAGYDVPKVKTTSGIDDSIHTEGGGSDGAYCPLRATKAIIFIGMIF